MARVRYIKPDFFTDGDLDRVSDTAQLVFVGLWTHADRLGRLLDKRRELAAKIRPYRQATFAPALDELLLGRFVVSYQRDGVDVLFVRNFEKHQRPHPNETPSALPDPPPGILIEELLPPPLVTCHEPSLQNASYSYSYSYSNPDSNLEGEAPSLRDGASLAPSNDEPEDPENFLASGPPAQNAPVPTPAPIATGAPAVPPAAQAPEPATTPATAPAVAVQGTPGRGKRGAKPAQAGRVPTLDDVRAEIARRELTVNAEAFFAHFDANGWVQASGQPIKRWQSALTTWALRDANRVARGPAITGVRLFAQPQRAAFPPSARAIEAAELEREADQARRNREAALQKHADQTKLDDLIARGLEEKYGDGRVGAE